MTRKRILRFEIMEPRITLSANASEFLADLQADIAANGLDPQRVQQILEQIAKAREETPVSPPPIPSRNDLGDGPIVQFRIDIRDLQDRPVDVVQAGGEYVAKIFVQDMRDLTPGIPNDHGSGGVFQAWVDLEFSPNLHPTGSIRLNQEFSSGKLAPEMDGSFLRNLGGVSRSFTPFGGAERFLFDTPFVVHSTDAPSRIQVVPSTSQPEPVLIFGYGAPVPDQSITSSAFDFPGAADTDPSRDPRPPVIDPSDDSSTKFPIPFSPSPALPDSGDGVRVATSSDDSVSLVSYIPFFRDADTGSRLKWQDEDDWLRSKRSEVEKTHSDEWNELDGLDENRKTLDKLSLNEGDSWSADDGASDEEETDVSGGKRQSKHTGLFYDEALFLEGAIVEPFHSKFRLHLQIFAPQRHTTEDNSKSIAKKKATRQQDGFIDIAEILTPNQYTKPWHDHVDEAIASNHNSPPPEYDGPAIDWGTIEPLPANASTPQQGKQAEDNLKLPDQRTPLAINQSPNNSSDTGPPPTVQ